MAKFQFHSAMAESALVRENLGDKTAVKDADFHFAEKWKIYWRIKRFCPGLAWVF